MNKSDHPAAPPEPAESSEKNLAAKMHLSDEDAALLEEFRNAVQKPAELREQLRVAREALEVYAYGPLGPLKDGECRHSFSPRRKDMKYGDEVSTIVKCGECGGWMPEIQMLMNGERWNITNYNRIAREALAKINIDNSSNAPLD